MSDTTHLDENLADLRSQIDALHPDDTASRQRLSGLMTHIEKARGTSQADGDHDELNENLNASVLHFEASHPRIAAVLNQLAEKLGTMGI